MEQTVVSLLLRGKWTKLLNRLNSTIDSYNRQFFCGAGTSKALKGWRHGCVKGDSELAVFDSGEEEVRKEDTDDFSEGADEGGLVEEGDEKGKGMKVSRRQAKWGDKTSTLQPRVMISCQLLTSSYHFCWSKLPSILFCLRLFSSPFFDFFSLSVLCSQLLISGRFIHVVHLFTYKFKL